jgi:hypothetical protein
VCSGCWVWLCDTGRVELAVSECLMLRRVEFEIDAEGF